MMLIRDITNEINNQKIIMIIVIIIIDKSKNKGDQRIQSIGDSVNVSSINSRPGSYRTYGEDR